jgi:Big-like domain-containing protein
MKTRSITLLRMAAAVAVLVSSGTAHAVLLDHGPADPTLVFPTWYRDTNGLALAECKSQTPSPNGLAGGLPMCFPPNPDPAGFPGNVGPESFYSDLTVILGKGTATFKGRYTAAVEGTYLPVGFPAHGTETVFARIRISMDLTVAGTYVVTHPFGVETFVVRPFELGPRAVFFTADVPVGPPMDFDTVLKGQIGPFPQWDVINPGESLSVTNPTTGVVESWVGDPNFDHTFTGSPFGTNFVTVVGPPGANLDGLGGNVFTSNIGAVLGQKLGAPIVTATTIKRATYSRDPVTNVIGVDVFATSAPASKMILTGVNLPTVQMVGDAAGNYFAHVEMPATVLPPASIQVNNMTSVPVNIVTAGLVDQLEVTTATFDSLTRTLTVSATSSDKSVPPPSLTVVGPFGGAIPATGTFTSLVPATALPPESISVLSSAGGVEDEEVTVLPGLPTNKSPAPVAVADVVATPQNVAVSLDVTANDSIVAPALVSQILVIVPPLNGKAAPIGINTGVVTYTPALNFFGTDTFQYAILDTTGAISNLATVTVTVTFIAPAPTAFGDDFAMLRNAALPLASRTYNVIANDVPTTGTTLNPASVVISTPPLHGSATPNLNGTVTYTPALGYIGADSYAYTVANNFGAVSLPATVNIVVEGAAEVLTIKKANFTVSKNQWNLVLTTNWFGPTLLHSTMTCYIGRGVLGTVIGTATADVLGTFTLVPPALASTAPDATNLFTCQTSNGGLVTGLVTRI